MSSIHNSHTIQLNYIFQYQKTHKIIRRTTVEQLVYNISKLLFALPCYLHNNAYLR